MALSSCQATATDLNTDPESKAHGVNMGPTWGWQDPGEPHVGHVNLVIWEVLDCWLEKYEKIPRVSLSNANEL